MTKKLLLIPIVHSEKEMGSLKSDISEIIDEKFGKEKRDEHRRQVAEFWDNLRILITGILNRTQGMLIRIYQDGIPIGGETGARLIAMGAKDGIPNFQIVLAIIESGGIIEKTEDPALLKEEYEIVKAIVMAKTGPVRESLSEKYKNRLYDLTAERDRYIAKRIAESLNEGELGILFIGATHEVAKYLPGDIDLCICNFRPDDITAWLAGGKQKTASPTNGQVR
jgi:hypothetical protein